MGMAGWEAPYATQSGQNVDREFVVAKWRSARSCAADHPELWAQQVYGLQATNLGNKLFVPQFILTSIIMYSTAYKRTTSSLRHVSCSVILPAILRTAQYEGFVTSRGVFLMV